MTLDRIFSLVNYISAKVISGNTLTPENYNDLLPMVSDIILNDELGKLIQSELTPIENELLSVSPLRPFRELTTLTVDSAGYATNPIDYVRWTSFTTTESNYIVGTSTPIGTIRQIKVLSDHNAIIQQGNVFARAEVKNFCFATGTGFRFVPYNIATADMRYIRKPATAYYDYCIDSDYNVVYMPVGSYITAVNNVNILYDVNDAVLSTGVTKSNMTYLPFPSATVELPWEDRLHTEFVFQLLKKVITNLKEPELRQLIQDNA